MKRIAIVNQRYGKEVNGGSEDYARELAHRLSGSYKVDVITTTALDYMFFRFRLFLIIYGSSPRGPGARRQSGI